MDLGLIFNIVDGVAAGVVLVGMLLGYRRGLSGEMARVAGVLVAFACGMAAYRPATAWLTQHALASERAIAAFAFAVSFLAAFAAMLLARLLLGRVMKVVFEGTFDRIGGVLAGGLKAALFVLAVLIVLNLAPSEALNRMVGEESAVGRLACRLVPTMRERLDGDGDSGGT